MQHVDNDVTILSHSKCAHRAGCPSLFLLVVLLLSKVSWMCYCICSTQLANLRNFEIALRKLEIAKLQTNFKLRSQVYVISKLHSKIYAISKLC